MCKCFFFHKLPTLLVRVQKRFPVPLSQRFTTETRVGYRGRGHCRSTRLLAGTLIPDISRQKCTISVLQKCPEIKINDSNIQIEP